MKAIIVVSFIIIIALIILFLLLIYYKISLDPTYNNISNIASLVTILLMLVTIISTENSTREYINSVESVNRKQIESWEKWDSIRRKQSIKSLIKEFKLNMGVYGCIQIKSDDKNNLMVANNFILTSLEKSLYNSPIDDDEINQKLLDCYYIMKGDDNTLSITRVPSFSESSLYFANSILTNFETKKEIIESTIGMLEKYEQNLK